VPIKLDGTKAVAREAWKEFQTERPTDADLVEWFSWRPKGIGIAGGPASGNLEILDFDHEADRTFPEFKQLVEAECPGLVDRLVIVQTPRPGFHLYYRCASAGRSLKWARVMGHEGKPVTLIETKGEGGYAVAPGSPLLCHPSGRPYRTIQGDLLEVPTITPDEREILLDTACTFNRLIEKEQIRNGGTEWQTAGRASGRPGDAFNATADLHELLVTHGWTVHRTDGDLTHWRRPGKDKGSSATTSYGGNLLYVFSTNADPFEAEHAYTPFAVYTLLNYDGDFSAAARDLAEQGYGTLTNSRKETMSTAVNDLPPINVASENVPEMSASAWHALKWANDPP
jgi:hypothetical protein